jgi:hypothetical protein
MEAKSSSNGIDGYSSGGSFMNMVTKGKWKGIKKKHLDLVDARQE